MVDDLGQYVEPQSQTGWTDLLKDPVARSGLLSFGLQAMSGGWGNGAQQLAQAIGAGATGAAGTAKAMQEQAINNRDFESKQEEGAATRASHEKIAAGNRASREEIGHYTADLRLQGVQERVTGMLERARMIHGPKDDAEWKFYQSQLQEARKTIEGSVGELKLGAAEREQMIEANAKERLEKARAQGMFGPGRGTTAPGTSTGSPAGPGPAQQGAPVPGQMAPAKSPNTKPSWEMIKQNPAVQELLRTPQGRRTLMRERPDLAPEIQNLGLPYEN